MVGFKEEKKCILHYLKKNTGKLDVISIVGMPGLGKTRLAYDIFKKLRKRRQWCCIWINVPHRYEKKKDVLLSILSNFTDINDDERCKTDHDISEMVQKHLENVHRFLIVMDNVWDTKVWTDLEGAFPKDHKAGKILITSQLEEVAHGNYVTRSPIRLCLKFEECWDLLQSMVFGDKSKCPPELQPFGKLIVQKCDGLPLLIVMVGKFLKKKCSIGGMLEMQQQQYSHGSILEMQSIWEHASASLSRLLDEVDFRNTDTSFYNMLPYHLRQCFLYTGMFPEGFEIPVRTLIRLWVAEGFIYKLESQTLEDIAIDYLKELINRNLVMVGKTRPNGDVKSCFVHYMLWQFCRKEASSEKENLFHEIEYKGGNVFEPSISNIAKHPRLRIDSNVNGFLSSHPFCPQIQSVLCFSKEDLQPANISSIPHLLKSLQVLDAKPIIFKELAGDWSKLALLKYVVLSINFRIIPKVISKLHNMQTFVVYTTYRKLKIKANIWKMNKLRHVETNVSTKLPHPKNGKEAKQLQTLGMISVKSCEEDLFHRLCSLRKLGIRGRLDKLVKSKGLNKLDKLKKLKLVNDLSAEVVQQQLPSYFPPNLRSLTLYATNLDWSHMSTLGALDKLEVLKLKDHAFRGDSWETSTRGFSQLQVLHIEQNDLSIWMAFAASFPRLECLVVTNCRSLQEIPISLKTSLRNLYLKGVKDSVVASAWRIKQAKKDGVLNIYNTSRDK